MPMKAAISVADVAVAGLEKLARMDKKEQHNRNIHSRGQTTPLLRMENLNSRPSRNRVPRANAVAETGAEIAEDVAVIRALRHQRMLPKKP